MTQVTPFKLVIEDDEGRRSVVPIELGEVSIGRLDTNTVRLNERNVSRRHARLVREDLLVFAEDLDSYNGLWINGGRVDGRRELKQGDVLRIGDFQLELRGEALGVNTEEQTARRMMGDADTQPGILALHGTDEPTVTQAQAITDDDIRVEVTDVSGDVRFELVSPQEVTVSAERPRDKNKVGADETQINSALTMQGRAKLICVSTQFAGSEFDIARTETVIGRVNDNDIGIDHRSVSRQHAKIVATGKRFKIVDLQSANGTFVNGEAYAQVELKRGDLIELGHVKLRFVPPGEAYTPTADELEAIRQVQKNKSWFGQKSAVMLALLGLGVALVGIAGFLMVRGNPEPQQVRPAPKKEVAREDVPRTSAQEADALMAQAHTAIAEHQLKRAQTFLNAVLALDPNRGDAVALGRQLDIETKAQRSFEIASNAVSQNSWSDAWNALQEIPKESAYYAQGTSLMAQVRPALAGDRLAECKSALRAEDFEEAGMQLEELEGLEPSHREIPELRTAIDAGRKKRGALPADKKTTKAAPHTKPKDTIKPVKVPPPMPAPAAASRPAQAIDSAQSLYGEAARALADNQVQRALELLNRCMAVDKGYALCYRALGIAYARSGEGERAAKYYRLYLKADPNAHDAPKVRELLQQYKSGHP